jgi:hypothetical protein
MKSVCIKRPSVLKHFQQLLLDKNGEAIRILLETPEFFDDTTFSHSKDGDKNPSNHSAHNDTNQEGDSAHDEHVNSLQIGINEFEINDDMLDYDVISCLHIHDNMLNPSGYRLVFFDNDADWIHSIADPLSTDSIKMIQPNELPRVQVDGGADRSITPHRELVHGFRFPDPSKGDKTYINDAGTHAHRIIGYGFFRVRCLDSASNPTVIEIPCAYIPSIPSTLLNFRTMPRLLNVTEVSNILLGVGAADLTIMDSNDTSFHLTVPLMVYKTRLYADNVLERCNDTRNDNGYITSDDAEMIKLMNDEPNRILWHARLGHLNFRKLSEMHKFAMGIPKFKQSHQHELCSTCVVSKLR